MELDINNNNSKKYKVETIYNNAIYIKKLINYLLELYYLVFYKNYQKEENT